MSAVDNPAVAPFVQIAGAQFDGSGNLKTTSSGGAGSTPNPLPIDGGNPNAVAIAGLNAVGQPPVNPVPVSGVDPNGKKQHIQLDAAGRQIVTDVSYATQAPAYAQTTVGNTAKALSGAGGLGVTIPTWATMAFVTPENGAIRYRADGTPPTTAIGQPIASGQSWPIQGAAALAAAQFIASANTTVSVEFRG